MICATVGTSAFVHLCDFMRATVCIFTFVVVCACCLCAQARGDEVVVIFLFNVKILTGA